MLRHRLITGPILIVALLAIVGLDDRLDTWTFPDGWRELLRGHDAPPRGLVLFLLAALVVTLAGRELSAIFRAAGLLTATWLTSVAALLGLVLCFWIPADTSAILAIAIVATGMILILLAALLTFSRHRNVQGVVAAAGAVLFAMVYLGLLTGFLLALRREHSAWWVVGVIFVTKACDTGAYFTGRAIGRHKLIPWLSPGKTWEGLAGGIVLAVVVAVALAAAARAWLTPADHVSTSLAVVCGVIFALLGQFGDLVASLCKRGAGLKDASRILPGLGGLLDVLDSPLMVAPAAFWLLAR